MVDFAAPSPPPPKTFLANLRLSLESYARLHEASKDNILYVNVADLRKWK